MNAILSRDIPCALRYYVFFTMEERKETLTKKGVCIICLKAGHRPHACHFSVRCLLPSCRKRHYTIMCPDLEPAPKTTKVVGGGQDNNRNSQPKSPTCIATNQLSGLILLQTLRVKLRTIHREVVIRILLDSASERSYIKRQIARMLF